MKLAPSLFSPAIAGLATILLATAAQAQAVNGAGSSFAAPIYSKWGEAASASTGVKLNYQAIGSGGGVNQITNRTVDFGASDAPVKPEDLATKKLFQFPAVIGGVDIIVNLPDIKPNAIKLTGELLSAIYRGEITKWNDPKLVEANRGEKLPNLAIAPVYRADASGTTFVFTDYLSKVDADWKDKVGSATSVKWPAGTGAKGSDGVAGTVRQVKGGIGYVEAAYAEQNKLTTTQLRNKAGQFVAPNMASFEAAAASADWSTAKNFAINLNDQPGAKSWPIESATFVLVPTDPKDAAQQAGVLKLFDWSFKNGDEIAHNLLYVPLPAAVKATIRSAWQSQLNFK